MPKSITTPVRFNEQDMFIRAAVANIDEKTRSFDVIFATETPVRKFDWRSEKFVDEILEISDEAIDKSRITGKSGVPFLDNHRSWGGVTASFGIAEGLRIEGDKAISRVRMSTRPNDPTLEGAWHDIKDGIIRSVSVGYNVEQYEKTERLDGAGREQYRAVKWTPMEISIANIPADPNAVIGRTNGPDGKPIEPKSIIEIQVRSINPEPPEKVEERTEPILPPADNTPAKETVTTETVTTNQRNEMTAEERAAQDLKIKNEAAAAAEAAAKTRVADIIKACKDFGVDSARQEEFLTGDLDIAGVRAAIQEEWAKKDPSKGAAGGASVAADEADKVAGRIATAIALRSGGLEEKDLKPEEVEAAREFRGMSLVRVAEEFMLVRGQNTKGMDTRDIATAALHYRSGVGMVTADFPSILGNAINRTLRKEYEMAMATWKKFCARNEARDFRPMTRAALGDAPRLKFVATGGEIVKGAMKDEAESYSVDVYAAAIPLDWRAIVNDDLNAFGRLPRMMAAEVSQNQSDIVYDVLFDNAALGADGVALFHADHGNLAGTGTVLDQTNLKAAIKAFRNQKSIGTPTTAGRYLNVTPSFLIVGPELEFDALSLVNSTIVPTTTDEVNPFKGMFDVIVEPRITDKSWYLAATPSRVDTIEYSILNGREYWTDIEQDFNTSGWCWKIEAAFGAKALDYRGLYKNAGV